MTHTIMDLSDIKILHQAGDLAQAEKAYLARLAFNEQDSESMHWLSLLYAEQGKFDLAESYLRKAIFLQPDDPTLSLHLANILKSAGSYLGAEKVLLSILSRQPSYVAARNNLGTVYHAMGDYQKAISCYQAAIDRQTNFADAYYNLGLALVKLNRVDEAMAAFDALLLLSVDHPGAHFQLGCLALKVGQQQKAITHFIAVETAHPFHFETQTNLATAYLKMGNLDAAKMHYLKAMDITPNDSQVLFNLGVIHSQQSRLRDAIDYYLKAVKLAPDNEVIHLNLAHAFLMLKDKQNALLHYQAALRISPDNQAIKHTIHIISQDKLVDSSPPDYISTLFDSYADHYDAHLKGILHYQVPTLFFDVMRPLLPDRTMTILDLGCGTGLCGEIFKSIAKQLVGVDLSHNMLALAREKGIYDACIEADIIPYLIETTSQHDLVLAGDVLVYFGDLAALFAAVSRVLMPSGYFVFNTETSHQADFYMTASGRFAHHERYVMALAKQHDLVVVRHERHPFRTQEHEPVMGDLYVLQKSPG